MDDVLEFARKAFKTKVWAEQAAGHDDTWHHYVGPVEAGMLATIQAAGPVLQAAYEGTDVDAETLEEVYVSTSEAFGDQKAALDNLLLQ